MTPSLFKSLVGPDFQDDAALLNLTRRMALDVGREGLIAQIKTNQTRPDQVSNLAKVQVPTLIIAGEYDQLTPPRHAEALHHGIWGSQLHVLNGCGHLGPLERPQEVAALIEGFL